MGYKERNMCIYTMYNNKYTVREIAERHGVTTNRIYQIVRKARIKQILDCESRLTELELLHPDVVSLEHMIRHQRAIELLHKIGVRSVRQLISVTRDDLVRSKKISKGWIRVIEGGLYFYGLSLRPQPVQHSKVATAQV